MSEFVGTVLRDVLLMTALVGVVVALMWLHHWKVQAQAYYAVKRTTEQREWLRLVGTEAFHYAERVYGHFDGPAKLNEAVKYVVDLAEEQKLRVTYAEVRAVVERAWAEAGSRYVVGK